MFKPTTREELKALIFENKVNLSEIDTSLITDMSYLFKSADFEELEGSVENWNTSHVENMSYMFFATKNFNQNIGEWNVGKVENMSFMFSEATEFNQYIGDWNVSSVKNMEGMFERAKSFNQDIGSWDVSNVENMENMFHGASKMEKLPNWYKE